MTTRILSSIVLLAALPACGAAQNVLNRIVTTAAPGVPNGLNAYLVFVDCDSAASTFHLLPQGYRPGGLVAMDRYGDVWLDEYQMGTGLHKFSSTGVPLAYIPHPYRAYYMTCDQQGNLIVGSPGIATGFLHKYSPQGQLLQVLDLSSLFAGGLGIPPTGGEAPKRILVTKSGAIWLALSNFRYGIVRLNADWSLGGGYGVFYPGDLIPDDNDGVYVPYYCPVSLQNQQMQGLPVSAQGSTWGCVHLSGAGALVSVVPGANTEAPSQSYHQARVDGRWYKMASQVTWSAIGGCYINVHEPWSTASNWFVTGWPFPNVGCPGGTAQGLGSQVWFWLDGAQRVWVLEWIGATNILVRLPPEGPYTTYAVAPAGPNWTPNGSGEFSSFVGEATLHLYCLYTDPDGDLDNDGIPNRVELQNKTNPLVPASQSMTITLMPGPPGSWMGVDYTIPGDGTLTYFSPFAFFNTPTAIGPFVIPFQMNDPLVMESLTPTWPWMVATVGVMDTGGHCQPRILIPAIPSLTGFQFYNSIVTRNLVSPTPVKTISPATLLTVQ